jgi:hypothetical protein
MRSPAKRNLSSIHLLLVQLMNQLPITPRNLVATRLLTTANPPRCTKSTTSPACYGKIRQDHTSHNPAAC